MATIMLTAATAWAQPPRFVYIDMGGLDEEADINEAEAINQQGAATGISFFLEIPVGPGQWLVTGHAYLKFPGSPMIDIGDQPEIQTIWGNRGWDLNDHNVVAGSATWDPRVKVNPTTGSWYSPGVLFMNGEVIDLGLPQGAAGGAFAYAVNNCEQVVGATQAPNGVQEYRGFLWESGALRVLDELGDRYSFAWDINDAGHIVGEVDWPDGVRSAFLLRNGKAIRLTADTPTGANGSKAFSINERSEVVGQAPLGAFFWRNGATAILPRLSYDDLGVEIEVECPWAYDLNHWGDIVGSCVGAQAVLWRNGQSYNLNEVANNIPDDVILWQARGVNNRGQIVGIGVMSGGRERAFLLDPVTPDFNHDDLVNSSDLARLLSQWSTDDLYADLDGDGVVNGYDLAQLLTNWGDVPPRQPYDWTSGATARGGSTKIQPTP